MFGDLEGRERLTGNADPRGTLCAFVIEDRIGGPVAVLGAVVRGYSCEDGEDVWIVREEISGTEHEQRAGWVPTIDAERIAGIVLDGEPGPRAALVPVGVLEEAARYCDEAAEEIVQRSHSDANIARGDERYDLARGLYAAGRGESVDWTARLKDPAS